MYILPLAILLVFLMFLVEGFAIAMKVTGLDIEKARFQVLSLLTGTGFTTRESELITQHPVRRRIAKILMMVNYIAAASLVTILFKTVVDFSEKMGVREYLSMTGGVIIVIAAFGLIRNKRFITILDHFIEYRILSRLTANKRRTVEEVLKLGEEYGVAEVILDEESPLVGLALKDSGLKQNYIQVLNIEGATHMIHFPQKDHVFEIGDKVVVYGKMENIRIFMSGNPLERSAAVE